MELRLDGPESTPLVQLVSRSEDWHQVRAAPCRISGQHAVYFTVSGAASDQLEVADFRFMWDDRPE